MDPVERLAADVQALKNRFDEMSLRFAVSEEREKRVDDKIDNMVDRFTSQMAVIERSMNAWNTTGRWVVFTVGGVVLVAGARWVLSGNLPV